MKTMVGGAAAIVVALAVFTGRPFASEVQAGQASANPINIVGAPSAAGTVTHDNPVLGYRMSLPDAYSRSESSIANVANGQELLGFDVYTSLTQAQSRERCLTDRGGTPPATLAAYLGVEVYRNGAGVSAAQWAKTRRNAQRRTVQPATVNGTEAARQVEDGKSSAYVISAHGRIYVLFSLATPSQHPLDDIAASFTALQPQPPSAPTTKQPPQQAARDLAQKLAVAFQNRDADAVAALVISCSLGVFAIVEPVQPGDGSCCVLNRAVTSLIQTLRDRFATGALAVVVNPDVQTQAAEGGVRYFVRSTWSDAGQVTPIDLFLGESEGQWRWVQAVHHYQRAALNLKKCVPYRSPWVDPGASC
jgi:hypothetical protein